MHRFFENHKLEVTQKLFLNKDNSHKIKSVLRLKKDFKIILFNNTNFEFIANIIDLNSKLIQVEILEKIFKDLSSPINIHLAQAIAKNDKMDWILQKVVELGVTQITPILTAQTIARPNNQENKILHWEGITIAACCQCGRNSIPKINSIIKLQDFLKKIEISDSCKLILSPEDPHKIIKITDQLPIKLKSNKEIIILIGPEGGFNQEELHLAETYSFQKLHLGSRILRTETAPIAILSILQALYGDL